MISVYYCKEEKIIRESDLRQLPQIDPLSVIWVDLNRLDDIEKRYITTKFGINLYEAPVGTPYNPALHERVGSTRIDGLPALMIAETVEKGYASQQPEFILRRPKVLVTE